MVYILIAKGEEIKIITSKWKKKLYGLIKKNKIILYLFIIISIISFYSLF